MGSGMICSDFVQALRSATGCTVTAVGARSIGSAEKFAKANEIEHAFGSYAELCECDEVDVVYIGTIHPMHKRQAIMAMRAGKHVLCEKPMTICKADTEELFAVAEECGVLLVEALWTRFFPTVVKARELIASGAIGEVLQFQGGKRRTNTSTFSFSHFLLSLRFRLRVGGRLWLPVRRRGRRRHASTDGPEAGRWRLARHWRISDQLHASRAWHGDTVENRCRRHSDCFRTPTATAALFSRPACDRRSASTLSAMCCVYCRTNCCPCTLLICETARYVYIYISTMACRASTRQSGRQ